MAEGAEERTDGTRFLEIKTGLTRLTAHLISQSVQWFNADEARARELASMLMPHGQGTSLRLADHLVVQYSRDTVIAIRCEGQEVPTELWLDYRKMLSCTGKKHFDVFKRRNAIDAVLLGHPIKTTIGQIVFLAWYYKRGLHEYMAANEVAIRAHMQRAERRSTRDDAPDRKREAMDVSAPRPKKRKARAPSRSDAVKPLMRVYEGEIHMTYT